MRKHQNNFDEFQNGKTTIILFVELFVATINRRCCGWDLEKTWDLFGFRNIETVFENNDLKNKVKCKGL